MNTEYVSETDNERIEKLPRWAQSLIGRLLMRLGERDRKIRLLEALASGETESDVYVSNYPEPDWLLPPGSEVTFELDEQSKVEIRPIDTDRRIPDGRNAIYICYSTREFRRLAIRPVSSNVIVLFDEERR